MFKLFKSLSYTLSIKIEIKFEMAQKDGGAGMAGAGMQIAGNIFNEMVMEEAIKDKTRQVQ